MYMYTNTIHAYVGHLDGMTQSDRTKEKWTTTTVIRSIELCSSRTKIVPAVYSVNQGDC